MQSIATDLVWCPMCVLVYSRWDKPYRDIAMFSYQLKRAKQIYGLEPEDYHELMESSESRCEICRRKAKRMVIDHCHDTGCVRGYLCSSCNTGIGLLGDDSKSVSRAVKYLSKGPRLFGEEQTTRMQGYVKPQPPEPEPDEPEPLPEPERIPECHEEENVFEEIIQPKEKRRRKLRPWQRLDAGTWHVTVNKKQYMLGPKDLTQDEVNERFTKFLSDGTLIRERRIITPWQRKDTGDWYVTSNRTQFFLGKFNATEDEIRSNLAKIDQIAADKFIYPDEVQLGTNRLRRSPSPVLAIEDAPTEMGREGSVGVGHGIAPVGCESACSFPAHPS